MINYFGGPNFGWPMGPFYFEEENNDTHEHLYSLVSENGPRKVDEIYSSREAANNAMYAICNKYRLQITKVWDDGHYKTYICSNGAKFFVSRV